MYGYSHFFRQLVSDIYGVFLHDVAGPYFQNNERRPYWLTKPNPYLVRPRTQAASLLCAADAFWIRWPEPRDTSPKCIDREGMGRGRTETRQAKSRES